MEVFALSLKLKEEGAAAVQAAVDKLRKMLDGLGPAATGAGNESAKGFKSMELAAVAAGAAIAGSLALGLKKVVDESSAAQFAQAQLESALKSTGGVSGQTAQSLNEHAAALQNMTSYADDAISGAQALLLTFTKIQGETFPQATQAVLNVATAMGTDLKSAAIQVGKALNDPVAGVSALARSGIQFTDSQKAMIASLVESGNQAAAQTLILKELENQFGGSAASARDTLGGALKALGNAFGELFEVTKDGAKPAINAIEGLIKVVQGIGTALEFVNPLIITFGGLWAAVNFRVIVSFVGMLGNTLYSLVPALLAAARAQMTLNTAMSANLFGAVVAAVAILAAGLSLYTIALDKATEARDKESATNPAYLAALEEIRKRRAALTAEQERANNVDAAASSRQEDLVNLASMTALNASELRELQMAERGYAAALQVANLPIATRVTLLERQRELQNAILEQARTPMPPSAGIARGSDRAQGINARPVIDATPILKFNTKSGTLFDPAVMAQAQSAITESSNQLRDMFAEGIGNSIGDGIAAGFERGFATGNIGEGFKALAATLLSGLGSAMIRFGVAGAGFANLMKSFTMSLKSLNGPAALAASIAMIAAGGALKGVAQGMFGGGGGGGGAPATTPGSFGSSGMGMQGDGNVTRLIFGATSATTAAGMAPRNATNVTIIGPDDPKAQRAIQELISKGNTRGTLG